MSDSETGGLFLDADLPAQTPAAAPYRVLARKYRPSTFAELIGQDALVRTLTNAFAQNRIAHAFMLTGVRGGGQDDNRAHHRPGAELPGYGRQGRPHHHALRHLR